MSLEAILTFSFLLAMLCGGIVLSVVFNGILGFLGVAAASLSAFAFGHLCGWIERGRR